MNKLKVKYEMLLNGIFVIRYCWCVRVAIVVLYIRMAVMHAALNSIYIRLSIML